MDSDQQGGGPPIAWPVRVKHPGDRRSLSRSATRALDVLEHFGQVRAPLRAVDISRALGLHPSTTNQLLKTMVGSAHLVFHAETKTYLPSHRLAQFSAWILGAYGDDERLQGLVREVQAAAGGVVTLTTANDVFMQIVELAGSGPIGRPTERGLSVSMFGSAIGAAYLSTLVDAEIARLAGRARIAAGDLPRVLDEAARIRAGGFAEAPSPDGAIWSIATPLPASAFPAPLVIGLAGPVDQVRGNVVALQELMRAAIVRWISRDIPCSP